MVPGDRLPITTLPSCSHPPPLPGLKASLSMQKPRGLSLTASWTQSPRHLLFPKPPSRTAFISSPRLWSQNVWSHPLFWKMERPIPFLSVYRSPRSLRGDGVRMFSVIQRFISPRQARYLSDHLLLEQRDNTDLISNRAYCCRNGVHLF